MSYRTDANTVKSVIEVFDASITDLTPFIAAAHILVDKCCLNSGYDDETLKWIETWLAAHFVAIRDPRVRSESAELSQSFDNPDLGAMLMGTSAGQQALVLDTAGNLARLSKQLEKGKPRIGFTYLGQKEPTVDPRFWGLRL